MSLLTISGLKTYFYTSYGLVTAVDDIDLDIDSGEAVGLVGESGSGKSVTALSIMRLVPSPPGKIVNGKIVLDGTNLLEIGEDTMRKIRGKRVSMVFQDPMTYLNPVLTIGEQIGETMLLHQKISPREARRETESLLKRVRIPQADRIMRYYPHQLSGGMRQRVLIAMAMSCRPSLLIADEPTTALDVTVQAQILSLLRDLRKDFDISLLLITHDLGIVAENCDRVYVMYAGKIAEYSNVHSIFKHPKHPYTKALLECTLSIEEFKKELVTIEGSVPDLINPPSGCRFHPRCPHAMTTCKEFVPKAFEPEPKSKVFCWLYG